MQPGSGPRCARDVCVGGMVLWEESHQVHRAFFAVERIPCVGRTAATYNDHFSGGVAGSSPG